MHLIYRAESGSGIAVVDLDEKSKSYGQVVHQVIMPNKGDEFHHFGWNACSSALSPMSGHAFLERRYLIVPKSLPKRGTRDRILFTVARKASMFLLWAEEGKTVPTARPEYSLWIAKLLRSSANMKWIEGHRINTTISGGIYRKITWSAPNGVCHPSTKGALLLKTC